MRGRCFRDTPLAEIPLPGVTVQLMNYDYPEPKVVMMTTSDADGHWAFPETGYFHIRIVHGSFRLDSVCDSSHE